MTCLMIYLDHNATTPLDPQVLTAMLPYFGEHFGNASSKNHSFGWKAKEAVESGRAQVASLLGASPREIVFTSGATESNNIAILGLAEESIRRAPAGHRPHVITQATEHHAVLDPLAVLRKRGIDVTTLQPDSRGRVSVASVEKALTERTILVSIMMANNEVGTLQPIAEIGALLKTTPVVFHTDAAQAVGKVAVRVESLNVDLLSLSAHKFYGPKGVGALYVRRGASKIRLAPLVHGGGQERGLRPGTLNVPGIVGLGEACRCAAAELEREGMRVARLRDRLRDTICGQLEGVVVNGHSTECLPGTVNLSFADIDGAALLSSLTGLAVSSGSACSTGNAEPSHVLKAMGVPDRLAVSTLRFGVGRFTTEEEVDAAIAMTVEAVRRLRDQLAAARGH
jgi:cysteine desulfurase